MLVKLDEAVERSPHGEFSYGASLEHCNIDRIPSNGAALDPSVQSRYPITTERFDRLCPLYSGLILLVIELDAHCSRRKWLTTAKS